MNGWLPAAGSAVLWKGLELLTGRGLAMLRLLVLALILAPEDFGLFAIAQVVVGTLLTLTDFGLLPALVQRRRLEAAHYHVAFTLQLARGLVLAGIVALAAPWIATLFGEPQATPVIRLLALRPLLEALISVKTAELEQNLRFRALVGIRLPGAVLETLTAIALAPGLGVWALPLGVLVGGAAVVMLSYLLAPYRPRVVFEPEAARPLVHFGRWIFATHVVAVVSSIVFQAVISRSLGAANLGLYYLGAKLAFLPSELASEVLGRVAFPVYARLQGDLKAVASAFHRLLSGAAVLLLPIYALLIALAPRLVENFLEPRWQGTAPVIRVLALVGILGLFGDLVVPLLRGLGQPQKATALEVVQSVTLVVLVAWMAGVWGLPGAAAAWLPAVALSQALALYHVRRILKRPLGPPLWPAVVIAGCSVLGGGVAMLSSALIPGLPGLVAGIFLAGASIVLALLACDRGLGLGLGADLAEAFPWFAHSFRTPQWGNRQDSGIE